MKKCRVFVPTTRYIPGTNLERHVVRWEWTPRALMVVYQDGIRCRSEWKTLTKFLQAVRQGHEGPIIEITGRGHARI